jgi:hypothetical protein
VRFDGALGDMEMASDFGVVAALEQKIDDLPLPGVHLSVQFVHGGCTSQARLQYLAIGQTQARLGLGFDCRCEQT